MIDLKIIFRFKLFTPVQPMTILKLLQRINKANQLIVDEKTGDPAQFAQKLGVSRSQLYNILDQFKDFGAPMKYNKKDKTYFYHKPFSLDLKYSLKAITENEEIEIFAGFFQNPILLDGTLFYLHYQKQSSARFWD